MCIRGLCARSSERAVALIVPSTGYETFGIVSLEAFAQHTPVIVRDLGGLTEAVDDSGGGYTYRTDEELTAAMEALRTDAALRRRLGNLGHDAFLRLWSEKPHLERYFAAIAEAGGAGTTARPAALTGAA